MPGEEWTTRLRVDVSEFKKGISDASKAIKEANATFKAETSGMDRWSKDAEGLQKKLNSLKTVLANQNTILRSYQGQLSKTEEAYEENGRRAEMLKAKLQELAQNGVAKTDAEYQHYESALKDVLKEQDNNAKSCEDLRMKILGQQAAIGQTERDIRHYTAAQQEMDREAKSIISTVDKQEQELSDLKKEYVDVSTAQGKNSDAARDLAKEIERLSKELKENKDKMNAAEKEADQLDKSIDDLGDSADEAEKKFGNLASGLAKGLKTGLVAFAAAAAAAVAGLSKASVSAAEFADEILTMSTVTGLSTDALQSYSYAAELVDVSLDTLTGTMAKNIKSMSNAAQGSAKFSDAYKILGISVTDANGELRDSETVYWETIDALGKVANETERDAIAMQLFGKSAQELNPLIAQGSEGINALADEAKAMGAVMSGETLEQLGQFDDSMQRLKSGASAAKNALGTVLLPQLQMLADDGVSLIGSFTRGLNEAGGDWTKISQVIGETIGAFARKILEQLPKLLETGAEIVASLARAIIGSAPLLVESASKVITTFTTTMLSSLPELIEAGVQLMENLLSGLQQVIPQVITAVVKIVPQIVRALVDAVPRLVDAAVNFFMAIVDAIPTIVKELQSALPQIVDTIVKGLTKSIPALINGAVKLFEAIVKAIPQIIPPLIAAIPKLIKALVDGLIRQIPVLLDGAVKLLMALVQAIPTVITRLVKELPKIIVAIVDTLLGNLPKLIKGAIDLFMGILKAIPVIVVELVKAMPQIIAAIVEGLLGGIGAVFAAAGELFFGIVDQSKAVTEAIQAQNEEIKAFADAMKQTEPVITDYNNLISEHGNTIAGLDAKTKEVEESITKILGENLGEQRRLRQEDIESIEGYKEEFNRLQAEKLEIYQTQQITELEKLKYESGRITKEDLEQRLANAETYYEQANEASKSQLETELEMLRKQYAAEGRLNSEAHIAAEIAAEKSNAKRLEANKGHYLETLIAAATAATQMVDLDSETYKTLQGIHENFNTKDGTLANATSVMWNDSFEKKKEAVGKFGTALTELEGKTENSMLRTAALVKANGGELSEASKENIAAWLGTFKNLPEDMQNEAKNAMLGYITGTEEYIPQLVNAGDMTVDEIIKTIENGLGIASPSTVMRAIGENTTAGLVQGMESKQGEVAKVAQTMADTVEKSFTASSAAMTKVGGDIGANIAKGLQNNIAKIKTAITTIINQVKNLFAVNQVNFQRIGTNIVSAIAERMSAGQGRIQNAVRTIIGDINQIFASNQGRFQQIGTSISNAIADNFTRGKSRMQNAASGGANAMLSTLRTFIRSFEDVGTQMARGVWTGFQRQEGSLTSNVRGMMRRLVTAVRNEMEVRSPSRVFEKIGAFMAEGLGLGFVREMKATNKAIQQSISPKIIVGGMLSGLQSGMAVGTRIVNNNSTQSFVQNIYAPKQPSRIELYRQTKNWIAMAKGV